MASYYFDTSALAKRYVVEVGSSWVQAVVAQQSGQTIYTSVLTQPELVSALQRRVREGNLAVDEALALAEQMVSHMTQSYALIAITAPVHRAGLYGVAQSPVTGLRCFASGVCSGGARGS